MTFRNPLSSRGGAHLSALASPLVVLALLAGLAAQKSLIRGSADDAVAYHAEVAALAADLPVVVGDWVGKDVPVMAAAVALLKPNALVNRRYVNWRTGETASLLLVQVRDPRDLLGHYPPNCYPAHGYTADATQEQDWDVGGLRIAARCYRFSKQEMEGRSKLVVDNFMVLPDGETARDMRGIDRAAQDLRHRYFGAAQIQILTDPSIGDERREEVFQTFVSACLPVIRRVASGVVR